MLMNPGKKYTRDGAVHTYPDARLIYNAGNNFMSHQQNTNELIRAMNKQVHTVINQDPWWCASSRFADIVLPATSALERPTTRASTSKPSRPTRTRCSTITAA